jgi:hypothetical protein
VGGSVELDDSARPGEVDLDAGDPRVDGWLRQVGNKGEEAVLQRASCAGSVGLERLLEAVEVRAAVGAGHRFARSEAVEQLVVCGLMDHVRELVGGEDVGQVDERAGHGRDRDAVEGGDVARVEVAGRVETEALLRRAATRCQHVNLADGPPPRLPQRRRAETAQRRTFTGGEHGRHVLALLRQPLVSDGVYASVDPVQRAGPHAVRYRPW